LWNHWCAKLEAGWSWCELGCARQMNTTGWSLGSLGCARQMNTTGWSLGSLGCARQINTTTLSRCENWLHIL
jgi:hypothetical protein